VRSKESTRLGLMLWYLCKAIPPIIVRAAAAIAVS
jgi:hypothetical protein